MTDYIRQYETPRHPFEKQEAERLITGFDTDAYTDGDGVIRWRSNNAVPPADVRALWLHVGKQFDNDAAEKAHREDIERAIRRYREAHAQMTEDQRQEEVLDRRAAFGPGQEVVNVLTGGRIYIRQDGNCKQLGKTPHPRARWTPTVWGKRTG